METKLTEVLSLELSGSVKKAVTSGGAMYAKSIVLATGAGPRELGVDGEPVSYTHLLILHFFTMTKIQYNFPQLQREEAKLYFSKLIDVYKRQMWACVKA